MEIEPGGRREEIRLDRIVREPPTRNASGPLGRLTCDTLGAVREVDAIKGCFRSETAKSRPTRSRSSAARTPTS